MKEDPPTWGVACILLLYNVYSDTSAKDRELTNFEHSSSMASCKANRYGSIIMSNIFKHIEKTEKFYLVQTLRLLTMDWASATGGWREYSARTGIKEDTNVDLSCCASWKNKYLKVNAFIYLRDQLDWKIWQRKFICLFECHPCP